MTKKVIVAARRINARIERTAEAFQLFGIDLPAELTQAVSDHETGFTRRREIRDAEPQRLTPHDLLRDDYASRVAEVDAAARNKTASLDAAAKAVDGLKQIAERTYKRVLPDLLDALQAWYSEHYDDLAREGDMSLHPARAEELTRVRVAFERAHTALLLDRDDLSNEQSWFLRHRWSIAAYAQLIDSTGPALSIRDSQNMYALAAKCGAEPNLAGTYADASRAHTDTVIARRDGIQSRGLSAGEISAGMAVAGWARVGGLK